MKKSLLHSLLLLHTCLISDSFAQAVPIAKLDVKLSGIEDNSPIPTQYAYCMPDGNGKTQAGGNISPAISWGTAPEQTRSFAVIVVDPDVPIKFDTANKPDKIISAKFPRQNFYHWVLVNVPSTIHGLLEGKDSSRVTPGGKPAGKTGYGLDGINGYGFGGYDGPCPPWNDQRLHHYHFRVYALDIPFLNLPSPVKGSLAEAAMGGHILAQGEVTGTYTNNPLLAQ